MEYLKDEIIDRLLSYERLVPALKEMHLRRPDDMMDMLVEQPALEGGLDRFLNRAAWQRGEALGIKLVTVFPNNPTNGSGFPTVQALYVLFEGRFGKPQALLDGTVLTWRKTAADSALGAFFLAREDVQSLLMVGAGAMAPELIRAHIGVRPSIRRVAIWNRSTDRAQSLIGRMRAELQVDISLAEDLESAARLADLISCATMTEEPLIKGAWLKPGAHLDLVGAFTPSMREADDEAMAQGRVYVDCRDTTIGHIGELIAPMRSGVLGEDDVIGDLFDLVPGKVRGRESDAEITVYKNGGGGHLDLMTARHAVERAREEGLL